MRDNFRARISMGRLSPQGAMMMWQDPSTGTTVPRGCRGRATTINDSNRPVETTYRMPDPRKVRPDDPDQSELLERLRPVVSRHDRLLMVPPDDEVDLDSEEGAALEQTYGAYANAKWVRASQRPDLDPLTTPAAGTEDARQLASPMAIFGLNGTTVRTGRVRQAALARAADDLPVSDDELVTEERFAGYGPAVDLSADRVTVGDLVLVDADTDHWAVVDEEPGEDPTDPTCLAVCWRDDADEAGLISLPDGERVTVRHPLEED